MKVLLRRPVATQSSGSDGLTADSEGEDAAGNDNGGEGQGAGGHAQWGVGVEKGVWDEPIIKRWEDAKVSFFEIVRYAFVDLPRSSLLDSTDCVAAVSMHDYFRLLGSIWSTNYFSCFVVVVPVTVPFWARHDRVESSRRSWRRRRESCRLGLCIFLHCSFVGCCNLFLFLVHLRTQQYILVLEVAVNSRRVQHELPHGHEAAVPSYLAQLPSFCPTVS